MQDRESEDREEGEETRNKRGEFWVDTERGDSTRGRYRGRDIGDNTTMI